MNLPKNLRYLREKRGVKPKDIAKATKMDAQTIYKWEHNKLQPSEEQLKKIAEYYGIAINAIKNTDLKNPPQISSMKTIAEKSPTNLSKNIRDLRSGILKTNRKGLAEKLGTTEDEVSHWEHGERIPDMETLSRIAVLFGTTPQRLHQKNPLPKLPLKSLPASNSQLMAEDTLVVSYLEPTLTKTAPSTIKPSKPALQQVPEEAVSAHSKLDRILSLASSIQDLEDTELEKLESFIRFLKFDAKSSH